MTTTQGAETMDKLNAAQIDATQTPDPRIAELGIGPGADLREIDLREIDLTGAYLARAYLARANLTGAIGVDRS